MAIEATQPIRKMKFAVLAILILATLSLIQPASAQTFQVLYTFKGGPDGGNPLSGVTFDADGNLYGTTTVGGNVGGGGVVYKLDSLGNETPLYAFNGWEDGGNPSAGVILDREGGIYGVTPFGGVGGSYGVVYTINKQNQEKQLYLFHGGTDAQGAYTDLIRDSKGNLYGTGIIGGAYNCGAVYRVTRTGIESVLYSFTCGNDGAYPTAVLASDEQGNLYGTTQAGGTYNQGVVFKLDPNNNETVLYTFTGGADGASPMAGVTRSKSGNLFGTAYIGGAYGYGAVYEISGSGEFSVLYSFTGGADGYAPQGPVTYNEQNSTLYSSAYYSAGRRGFGTVFALDLQGHFNVLHSFTGRKDGGAPSAKITLDAAGNLYSTTPIGGPRNKNGACPDYKGQFGCGIVYKITP
jgi:uncharacterized repeat protein (TIGR03803 family)